MPVRIVVADDHDVVREGIKTILKARPEWAVCGEAADGQEALEQVKSLHPEAVILDITMPRVSGLEAAQKISQLGGATRILMVTMHDSDSVVRAAKDAGANGLVTKAVVARYLVKALDIVLKGGTFFGPNDSSEPGSGHNPPRNFHMQGFSSI